MTKKMITLYKTKLYNNWTVFTDRKFKWELLWKNIIEDYIEVDKNWKEINHFLYKFRLLPKILEKKYEKSIIKQWNIIQIEKELWKNISLKFWVNEKQELINYLNKKWWKWFLSEKEKFEEYNDL